jgi:hypothetical protein
VKVALIYGKSIANPVETIALPGRWRRSGRPRVTSKFGRNCFSEILDKGQSQIWHRLGRSLKMLLLP